MKLKEMPHFFRRWKVIHKDLIMDSRHSLRRGAAVLWPPDEEV